MTSVKEHKKALKEYEEDIKEKIRRNLLVERQKVIGFCASEASTNLFAILLHNKNLISEGFSVNHRFFSSTKNAERRFNFPFEKKEKILNLLVQQEKYRDLLCYGRERKAETVKKAIKNYFNFKDLIIKEIGDINGTE